MHIIASIWSHLTGIFGTVVLVTALISVVIGLIERYHYATQKAAPGLSPDTNRNKAAGEDAVIRKDPHSDARKIAVITGASSGLGSGYAKAIDKSPKAYDVNEIWLIARRKNRLDALARQLHLPVYVIPMDLTDPGNLKWFEETLKKENDRSSSFSVSVLLNCAGFGKFGTSSEIGHTEEGRMIDVNDKAAVNMTDLLIPYMRPGSRIGQICSVAAFQPIPGFNAYAASKALLYSYSRALRVELLKHGISVTAVCPYWIKDTEFIEVAAGKKRNLPLASRSDSIIRFSLWDIRHNHALSTPGVVCTLDRIFAGLIPDEVMVFLMKKFL